MLRSTVAPPENLGVPLTSKWTTSSGSFQAPKQSYHEATFSSSANVDNGVRSRYAAAEGLTAVKVKVGKESPPPTAGWNPRASMAYDSAKGLLNPLGENNCFLNSAIQVLWNLDAFRRNFRLLSGHACMGSSCIFCALKTLFTQYQFGDCPALPAFQLRDALAETFADQQRYQLGLMDDAAECFENILMRIHVHIAHGVSEDACNEPHCIPHQKFSMTVVEQAVCQCEATCEPFAFSQIVHYVSTCAVIEHARATHHGRRPRISFGHLISSAASDAEARTCPMNCGGRVSLRRTLTNTPDVISIGFVWDSDRPSSKHISRVVSSIGTVLHPAEMFYSVVDAEWAVSTKFHLVGVVCYYGQHYTTFFFHSKMKIWILFDDSRVKKLGPDWKCVAERCCRGRYQPLLLLYANKDAHTIDVSTAPTSSSQIRHTVAERPRDVTRRSLLPPRDYDRDLGHSDLADPTVSHGDIAVRLPSTSNYRKSYLNAVNEMDEISSEVDYSDTVSTTSNYDTMSSITSGSSRNSSSTHRQYPNPPENHADGSRYRSTADSKVSPYVGLLSSQNSRPGRDATISFRSSLDDSDSEPYITSVKVQKVLESQSRQVLGRASGRGDGSRSVPPSETHAARNGEYLDTMSLTSHKDSGYRSNEDRLESASMQSSPTLSASTLSLEGGSTLSNPKCGGPVGSSNLRSNESKFMCSSFESLSSVQTTQSSLVNHEILPRPQPQTVQFTSNRQISTDSAQRNTEKHVNFGVPFTYGQPTIQILGNNGGNHKNTGSRPTVEYPMKQTIDDLLLMQPSHVTSSGHPVSPRDSVQSNGLTKKSLDTAKFDHGVRDRGAHAKSHAVVAELSLRQPQNRQPSKYDQSTRLASVVKDRHEHSRGLAGDANEETKDTQLMTKFQQLERPVQNTQKAASYQGPINEQCRRQTEDVYHDLKYDPRSAQDTKQLNNYPAQDVRQVNNYPAHVNNKPAQEARQMNNYPAQDVRQGNNYPAHVNNKPAQEARQGNNYPAQDVRQGINYPAQNLSQVNKHSTQDTRQVNKNNQVVRYDHFEASHQFTKPVNQYQAANYEQHERSTFELMKPTSHQVLYGRSVQGSNLYIDPVERNVGPVLLARQMPEPVSVGRQCDRSEVEFKPPTGSSVSQARPITRVIRLPEADVRSTSGSNLVPSYPYQSNPDIAQRDTSKDEASSVVTEAVFVKGRRCVTPVGGLASRSALSASQRPPPAANNSRDTPVRQDTSKGRTSRGTPAAMASRHPGLESKAKSVTNLSSKPAWKS